VTPLASLTSLTALILQTNQIKDVTPLASLTALTKLGLGENQIQEKDRSPLQHLQKSCRILW
jgi:internalin A